MPQLSDEVMFIALISGIAIFVLIVLLAGVFIIHHYEHRRNNKLTLSPLVSTITDFFPKSRPKEGPSLSPPDVMVIQSAPEVAPNNEPKIEREAAQIVKLESLHKGVQSPSWVVCVILASTVALLYYFRELYNLNRTPLHIFFVWLAIIIPTCIAVGWLRLIGIKWRQALLLFIWVPAVFCGVWIIVHLWILVIAFSQN